MKTRETAPVSQKQTFNAEDRTFNVEVRANQYWTLDVERWTFSAMSSDMGIANPNVIDAFGFDQQKQEVLLVMNETRPWSGSDEQLHELQEKFNAYASFILDGEMVASHPELAGKRLKIELRTDSMPDERALALLESIHEQLALQEIRVEVVVREKGCGSGCACHGS